MKNLFLNAKAKSADLIENKQESNSAFKKALHDIVIMSDAMAIILIMLGGIIAVAKETRAMGVGIAIAGFTMLFLRLNEKLSDSE